MKNMKEFIQTELSKLDRGIIATPKDLDTLYGFTNANHGSNDFLLTHMAMQFGMKLALQYLADEIEVEETVTQG